MKSVLKLIRRFVGILLLSLVLLFVLNVVLLGLLAIRQAPNAYPWKMAEEVADHLRQGDHGYCLSEETALALKNSHAWAIFIDNETRQVVWQTEDLPETIPMSYSISDIAGLTRGYIDGYPTFTGEAAKGLVVVGYPRDSFWKHMWPSWDYRLIANLPKTVLSVLGINIAVIFIIYVVANSRLLKSVKPIVNGIQSLPSGEYVEVREKGLLWELASSINKTSQILQSQSRQLRKRETARANWIAGVSHDIRTPLSMVMGYADRLKNDLCLTKEARQQAAVIVKQSERMRDLVNDLNLASKLEYNMQPIHLARQNIVSLVRQVVVDFINMDLEEKHPIEWETKESLTACFVCVDQDLMKRAVSNLIQNCINHNGEGCHIFVGVLAENGECVITVADDGAGVSEEQLKRLNRFPHYMACDKNTSEQRHGLGLLIVKQIMAAHGGAVKIGHSVYGGFLVELVLPAEK